QRLALPNRRPAEAVADTRTAQDPGRKGIAVGPGPREVALAVRIAGYVLQHRLDRSRLGAGPLRGDARRPASYARVRGLEVAVHMANAPTTRVLRLPDIPAVGDVG